jgi:hypothetical protein
MKPKIKLIFSITTLIVIGSLIYEYTNRGGSCEVGEDSIPMTAIEKNYHDSIIKAQNPYVQKRIDSIQRIKDTEMNNKIGRNQQIMNTFVGKWQGVSDEIYTIDDIPTFEIKKKEFKERNPFVTEDELNSKTTNEIEKWKQMVNKQTKRTNNYYIEFIKVTNHGEGNSYHFVNKNNNTFSEGEWTITINGYNDTTLWLLDNKTNKTFEHSLQRDYNGNYTIRMPIHKKGEQNTKMKRIE